jgi:hypothetical protein
MVQVDLDLGKQFLLLALLVLHGFFSNENFFLRIVLFSVFGRLRGSYIFPRKRSSGDYQFFRYLYGVGIPSKGRLVNCLIQEIWMGRNSTKFEVALETSFLKIGC